MTLVDTHTGEIVESTDLVPTANMAALEALSPADQEAAVTRMLAESRSWLAHAMQTTEPAQIAHFKAYVATLAESTKQLGLAKDIQLDAQEMVRRAERGIGVAIRKGQEVGEIQRREDNRYTERGVDNTSLKPSPTDFAPAWELSANHAGIYHMTDGVSDEQFDQALDSAKAEANLSRANVVRKIRDEPKPTAGRPSALYKMRRLDSNRIVGETVAAASHMDAMLSEVTYADLDRSLIEEWISSLSESIKALAGLKRNLEKELTR